MSSNKMIKKLLSINNNYDKKWLKSLDKDYLNKLLVDNMIISQNIQNRLMLNFK